MRYCWIIALTQNSQLRIRGNIYASSYFYGRFSTLNLQTIHNERGQNNEQPDSFILFNSSVTADGCMSSFYTLRSTKNEHEFVYMCISERLISDFSLDLAEMTSCLWRGSDHFLRGPKQSPGS